MSEWLEALGNFRGGPRGWNLKVFGLKRTQDAMLRNAQRVKAESGLKRAWLYVGPEMLDYARKITHKWTGALAASHRLSTTIDGDHLRGLLYIDENAQNPITGIRTEVYGPVEHARGGSHAFYERTFDHFKRRVESKFMDYVLKDLETE